MFKDVYSEQQQTFWKEFTFKIDHRGNMNKVQKGRVLKRFGIAIAITLGASAIQVGTGHAASTPAPTRGGTLSVAITDYMVGFCPNDTNSNSALMPVKQMGETLFEQRADGVTVPFLASSASSNADFTSWRITIRPGVISLTHVLQVEKEGALQGFVQSLGERAGKVLELKKLNEGLRINYKEVVTPHAAQLVECWSELDFAGLIYEHEQFSLSKTAVVLSERETKLIRYIREVSGRLDVVATEMQTRVSALEHQVHNEWLMGLSRQGARYGLKEILRRLRGGLRG